MPAKLDDNIVMYNGTVRALSFADQVKAAALAGCGAISTGPFEYLNWLGKGLGPRDLLTIAADHGVRITHLDPFVRWVPDWLPEGVGAFFPAAVLDFDADAFFRMAEALDIRSFSAVGTFPEGRYGHSELADHFGALCERAARYGLRVDLEFVPFWGIVDLAAAWKLVGDVAAPNSGIMLDCWHYTRSRSDDELLRTIPGRWITGVQLDDGDAELPDGVSITEDTIMRRRPPGEGEFRVREIVGILKETGGLNNYGPEIFSAEFDGLDAETIADRCRKGIDWALG